MKKIKNQIKELDKIISVLEDNKDKEVYQKLSEIISGLSEKFDQILVNEAVIAENIKYIDQDISNIQDEIFEEISLEDIDKIEEEYKEFKCKNCGKPIYLEQSVLENNKDLKCPYCNKNIL